MLYLLLSNWTSISEDVESYGIRSNSYHESTDSTMIITPRLFLSSFEINLCHSPMFIDKVLILTNWL